MMTMTMTMTTTNRMLSFGGFSKGAGELDKKNQRAGGGGNRASGAFPCRAAAPSLSSEKRRRRKKKKHSSSSPFFSLSFLFVCFIVSFVSPPSPIIRTQGERFSNPSTWLERGSAGTTGAPPHSQTKPQPPPRPPRVLSSLPFFFLLLVHLVASFPLFFNYYIFSFISKKSSRSRRHAAARGVSVSGRKRDR